MDLVKRDDGWWITGVSDDVPECGPYETKADAQSDLRGMQRFDKYQDEKDFMTLFPKEQELSEATKS